MNAAGGDILDEVNFINKYFWGRFILFFVLIVHDFSALFRKTEMLVENSKYFLLSRLMKIASSWIFILGHLKTLDKSSTILGSGDVWAFRNDIVGSSKMRCLLINITSMFRRQHSSCILQLLLSLKLLNNLYNFVVVRTFLFVHSGMTISVYISQLTSDSLVRIILYNNFLSLNHLTFSWTFYCVHGRALEILCVILVVVDAEIIKIWPVRKFLQLTRNSISMAEFSASKFEFEILRRSLELWL